jgi:hypothetical protein
MLRTACRSRGSTRTTPAFALTDWACAAYPGEIAALHDNVVAQDAARPTSYQDSPILKFHGSLLTLC